MSCFTHMHSGSRHFVEQQLVNYKHVVVTGNALETAFGHVNRLLLL